MTLILKREREGVLQLKCEIRSSFLRKEKELGYKADSHNQGKKGKVWTCSASQLLTL